MPRRKFGDELQDGEDLSPTGKAIVAALVNVIGACAADLPVRRGTDEEQQRQDHLACFLEACECLGTPPRKYPLPVSEIMEHADRYLEAAVLRRTPPPGQSLPPLPKGSSPSLH